MTYVGSDVYLLELKEQLTVVYILHLSTQVLKCLNQLIQNFSSIGVGEFVGMLLKVIL